MRLGLVIASIVLFVVAALVPEHTGRLMAAGLACLAGSFLA